MAEFNVKLRDLKEKIVSEFDRFKDFTNFDETNELDKTSLDNLLFKIKYQIDQMKNDVLSGRLEEDSTQTKDVESQKADALIKLQTLLSLITCHVINLDKKL